MLDNSFDNVNDPNEVNGTQNGHVPVPQANLRGLPAHGDLCALAQTYVQNQHALWPALVDTTALPDGDDASVKRLASQFAMAYRSCRHQPFSNLAVVESKAELGAAYVRYSDANSNTRSLDQQLVNVLRKARSENVFIPWPYVFADAAIPGTTTDRNGYKMLQEVLLSATATVSRVVVDDLDRLNRDQIESHLFMRMIEVAGKRVTTVDGFDSAAQMSKITHAFKAMQNDFFNDQIKDKVNRGMEYAFNQGKNLGLPPLGFKTVPKLDGLGHSIINKYKKVETEVIIDKEAAELVRRIFTLYVDQKMSGQRIARLLNDESALGKTGWGVSGIMRILKNTRYIGIYTWRRRQGVKNPVTGKRKDIMRPESEHLTMEFPEMRLVSDELWNAVQKRIADATLGTPGSGHRKSRQALYPTRLFDLYCRDCDRPLRLDRMGKYAQMCCAFGKEGKPQCRLRKSKSLSIIDNCILGHLQGRFFDQEAMDHLLERANAFLIEEAAKPPVDTVELEKKILSETERIKRLATRVANLDDGPAADLLMQKIQESQSDLTRLQSERAIAATNNFRPQPIDRDSLEELLSNLRDLLMEDVVASQGILAKALGRVYVTQGPQKGAFCVWNAELVIDEVAVLVEIAKKKKCPTLDTLDFLLIRSWTSGLPMYIELDQRNRCGELEFENAGFPVNTTGID